MAQTLGSIIADTVAKLCTANECPYRYGDSEAIRKKLESRLEQKIKHRLADGNEVRKLERRVADLEKVLKMCLSKAASHATFTNKDIGELKKVLNPEKKG